MFYRISAASKLFTLSVWVVPLIGQVGLTTAQIAKRVSPSVVLIEGKTDSGDVLASGFIVSKDGKIVTNLHVIRDMKSATVKMANGASFDSVTVVGTDERRDLAILQVAGSDLPALDLGDSDTLTVGEPVVVIGSPRGLEGTVTAGILSSVRDSGEGFSVLQTDAAVNPGNSGGPLVNTKGQAIGAVSFKLVSAEGLNIAVPISYVKRLLNGLHEPITLAQMRKSLSVSALPARTTQTTGPSLKETLDWLRDNIPLGNTHISYKWDNSTVTRLVTDLNVWKLDSCNVTIGYTELNDVSYIDPPLSNILKPVTKVYKYTLSLGAVTHGGLSPQDMEKRLAPHGTVIGGDRTHYYLILTTESNDVRSQMSIDSKVYKDENERLLVLSFANESLAQRVLAAFLHAGDLCKQKEPF